MDNEELLQQTINVTLERLGKQSMSYEAEIANLNAKVIMLNSEVNSLRQKVNSLETQEDS